MPEKPHFSNKSLSINGIIKPCAGWVVGYTAIISTFKLAIPIPEIRTMVSEKNQRFEKESWQVLPVKYLPEDDDYLSLIEALHNQLVFALKYEGVNLLVFSKLNEVLSKSELYELVSIEPLGEYTRRIWFLLEWVSGKLIDAKSDISRKNYVPVLNEKLQFGKLGIKSPRHLVINNLPGSNKFCPLIRKSKKLLNFLDQNLAEKNNSLLFGIRKDIIQRAAAFLLLKDSKASFTIEGESPKSKRAARWGQAIGQAGINELTKEEFLRLQEIVIENSRFIRMGYRTEGGFIGEHDRLTNEPIPDHISARHEDIEELMEGLIEMNQLLLHDEYNAVLAAASIAFGFVFIHPFEDGNGRIHRYLIHHILAKKKFSQQGIVFPISYSILNKIDDYRKVLESYSKPILDNIDWTETPKHNVLVKSNTRDFYRFFDATRQAEFLFDCVQETIDKIIPEEIRYLMQYDYFKKSIDEKFDMPENMISLLVRFLDQNNGILSNRAKEKEFNMLTEEEIERIQTTYNETFKKI